MSCLLRGCGIAFFLFFPIGALSQGHATEATLLPGFPVTQGQGFAWLFVEDLDGDGAYEIIHGQTYAPDFSSSEDIHILTANGTERPGFPLSFPVIVGQGLGYTADWPMMALDLDGDGQRELVSEIRYPPHYLTAYDASGSLMPGFPVPLAAVTTEHISGGDVDGDGADEIVVALRPTGNNDTRIRLIDGDGSIVWEREFEFDAFPGTASTNVSVILVADLNYDGKSEIVISSSVTQGFDHLGIGWYILDHEGNVLPGWPLYGEKAAWTVVDIDGDDVPEFVSTGHYSIHVYGLDGSPRIFGTAGALPAQTLHTGLGCAVADLNGDGSTEFVYPGVELELIDVDVNAQFVLGEPFNYSQSLAITSSTDDYTRYDGATVADVDGDGVPEILAASRSGPNGLGNVFIHVYRQNLQDELPGWPKEVPVDAPGEPFVNGSNPHPATMRVHAADLNGDGDLEVVYRSVAQVFAWDIPQVENPLVPETPQWTTYFANSKWNGWFHEGRVPNYLPGDFNGDNVLSLPDAIGALNYMFAGGEAGDCPAAIDINGDGVAGISDAIGLLDYMFLPGSPAPARGLECRTFSPRAVNVPCSRFSCP